MGSRGKCSHPILECTLLASLGLDARLSLIPPDKGDASEGNDFVIDELKGNLIIIYWIKAKMRNSIRLILFCTCMIFFMCGGAMGEEKKITIGVVEDIILMPWGIKLPARIDTGAAMSSLDARDIVIKNETVEFKLPKKYGGKQLSLPIVGWRTVRSSEARDQRPVVMMEFCLGSKLIRTQVNLNDRSGVRYPFLVGRKALQKDFVLDCNKIRCAPPTCP